MVDQSQIGLKFPSAKPVSLTFYDWLRTYPYSTTFYVRDNTSDEQVHQLIQAVRDLSTCVLGKYKIGYQSYLVPDYDKQLAIISPYVMGTQKWVIKYRVPLGAMRSHAIPGRNHDYTLSGKHGPGLKKRAHLPYREHPKWQAFLDIFQAICVSSDNQKIIGEIELNYRNEAYPPKGAK